MVGFAGKGVFLKELESYIEENKDTISISEAKDRNSLVFAFVGDAVFSLFVRTYLATKNTAKAGKLHTTAVQFVRASYQSMLIDELLPGLTETEHQVVMSARNAKTNNVAKNSNLVEYKKSTSFEALLGYLYLTNQKERLFEILEYCKTKMGENV
jgi:ribonuclease-3 family protein